MDSATDTRPLDRRPHDAEGADAWWHEGAPPVGGGRGTPSAPWPAPAAPPPAPPAPPAPTGGRREGLPLRSYLAIAAVSALAAGAVVLPAELAEQPAPATSTTADEAVVAEASSATVAPLAGQDDVVAAVAEQLSPSVVRIDVGTPGNGGGSGSGVVLDADGNILTNAHVVGDATEVRVLTPDGDRLDATVVGRDPASDIAIVTVDASLPVPDYAAAEPRVGSTAVAIGSPFGLDGSVTSGVVSAVGRTVPGDQVALLDMLQTDAAINPGNSGGALADSAGRVIGINTAILSPSGANDGIGFAVPTATALDIAEQLLRDGEVRAGWLGVEGQSVDRAVAEQYGLATDQGAIIAEVLPGSPAAEAGLEGGDVVVAVDGEEVASMTDLASRIRRIGPGETTQLTVLRDGREQQLGVTLGDRPSELG